MRTMPESHVFRREKPVHRLPGDILSFVRVSGEFLDLGIVRGHRLMTGHAECDVGNSSVRTFRRTCVTARTLHPVLKMKPMIERDGLHRSGLPLEVLSHRIDERFTARFEDGGEICGHGDSRGYDSRNGGGTCFYLSLMEAYQIG